MIKIKIKDFKEKKSKNSSYNHFQDLIEYHALNQTTKTDNKQPVIHNVNQGNSIQQKSLKHTKTVNKPCTADQNTIITLDIQNKPNTLQISIRSSDQISLDSLEISSTTKDIDKKQIISNYGSKTMNQPSYKFKISELIHYSKEILEWFLGLSSLSWVLNYLNPIFNYILSLLMIPLISILGLFLGWV